MEMCNFQESYIKNNVLSLTPSLGSFILMKGTYYVMRIFKNLTEKLIWLGITTPDHKWN